MKRIVTQKDIQEALASRNDLDALLAGATLTPAARDFLLLRRPKATAAAGVPAAANGHRPAARASSSEARFTPTGAPIAPGLAPKLPDEEFHWKPGSDPKTPDELLRFFHSPEITRLKEKMVALGQRIWRMGYVDGNGGNITVRVGDNLVLCTPTLISKGFMSVEDLCMVDLEGNQVAGTRPRTSEVNTHLGIMRSEPKAKACVHAHPPHATAFAVASVKPPTCLIPEPEVFLGEIGLAPYQTPGTPENAATVGALAPKHQAILMENHGVIVWGKDLEDAYWKMENTDAYCRIVWIASQLGTGLKQYSPAKLKELIAIRKKLGMPDHRADLQECELCDNDEFRPGVVCITPPAAAACGCHSPAEPAAELNPEAEKIVQTLTDRLMAQIAA